MKFPKESEHTAAVLEKWAKDFNDLRAKNTNAEDPKIPRGEDEVCLTFEKYPGLFNKHIDEERIGGAKIQEVQIFYFIFFSMFLFIFAACLMFFVILFVFAEHLMILKGGDAFDGLNKCALASSLVCCIFAIIGCALLAAGLAAIHQEFLTKILEQTCKYNMSSMTYASLAPAAVAAVFFLVGGKMSFIMYKD